ncbi:hypothetical protein [Vandammella animalimorsus]|nr:hypothetical protein [Vandammella animalimorsus]
MKILSLQEPVQHLCTAGKSANWGGLLALQTPGHRFGYGGVGYGGVICAK